jgi:peptide/nickel transport system permease protein
VILDTLDGARSADASASPHFVRRLLRQPVAVVCIAYLAVVLCVAIVAPLALPQVSGEQASDLGSVHQGPSSHHLLGTDSLGRDVLERLLVGTRPTMIAVAEALIVVLLLGVPLGLIAGYFGGVLDRVVGWLADLAFSMPALIVVLVVLTVFPQSTLAAMVTIGVLGSPFLMRVVRSATLPVREELYVAAARVSGLSRVYILSRHVLPRNAGVIIVQASLFAGGVLLAQAGLAFLGLLVKPPAPSWGGMLTDGIQNIVLQPWLIWPPGIVIALTILAFGLLADAVSDASSESWRASAVGGKRPRRAQQRRPVYTPAPARKQNGDPVARDALLAVEGLQVTLPSPQGGIKIVEDVSFAIGRGEIVGIVGESGCGKTMTAMSILGLLPGGATITAGRVRFEGIDLAALPEAELRRVRGKKIALVSQDPMVSLNPAFRVGWQLADCLRVHHSLGRTEARLRAVDLLAQVHLPDPDSVARRYPHELSGGMAQRVAIARALSGDPRLLIADEPTSALDLTIQAEILDLLRELQRDRGMAVMLITHDWGVVADLCDQVVVMYAGQIVERAGIGPMFRQPLHPYTQALLVSNPTKVALQSELLPTIPGTVPAPGAWPSGCHFHPRCAYATSACRQAAIPLAHPTAARATRCIHHEELVTSS